MFQFSNVFFLTFFICRYLNSFLNSDGGTIYFGVEDDSTISGLDLSRDQDRPTTARKSRDHMRLTLDHIMGKSKPPVAPHQYSLTFEQTYDKVLDGGQIAPDNFVVVVK